MGLCSSLEFVAVFSLIFFASPCLTYPKEPVYHLGHIIIMNLWPLICIHVSQSVYKIGKICTKSKFQPW